MITYQNDSKGPFSISKLNGRMVTVGYHKFYPGEINDTKLQAPKGVSTFSPSHRHNLRHNAGPEFANRDFFEERAPWIDDFTYYALQPFYSNFYIRHFQFISNISLYLETWPSLNPRKVPNRQILMFTSKLRVMLHGQSYLAQLVSVNFI